MGAERKILFVRSGGGFPGIAIHAGIWKALSEYGVYPSEVAGTSAGAVVSLFHAFGYSSTAFECICRQLSDSQLRQEEFLWKLRIPWLDHFLKTQPIEKLLSSFIASREQVLPLSTWATRAHDGASVNSMLQGNPVDAVLASLSIPGVFPPKTLADGVAYVDGGVRKNLPLPTDWRDYDEVWLLIASVHPFSYRKTSGILTNLFRSVDYLCLDQIKDVLDETAGAANVHVIWPKINVGSGMLHWPENDVLSKAYVSAVRQLEKGAKHE